MTANYFQIYRYVGDSRRLAHEHNVQPLKGVLTKTHPIFSEHNVERTLIVSTYQTFRQRHSVAIHERTSRDQFGKPSAQREATDSGDWAGNLEGKFQTVIMDEAHEIKDERADVSATIRSLQTPFHIMLTATPIPNGIDDWKGYVEFIKPSDMSDDSMDPEQVRKMKLPKHIKPRDFNPFHEDLVSREHPAAWIRFTMRAAQEHIFSTSVSDEIKGINLHSIWKSCLMRRTNSSMIPFNTGRKISDDIPRVHAVNIQCKLGARDGEKTVYEQAREELQAGLVNKKGKKLSWSLRHQRKLILLSTATYLPKLDENFDLRANNIRKILDKDHFWVEWLQYLFPATPLAQYRRDAFRQLTLLLNGAPKIRAFLNIIKTQVRLWLRSQRQPQILMGLASRLFEITRKSWSLCNCQPRDCYFTPSSRSYRFRPASLTLVPRTGKGTRYYSISIMIKTATESSWLPVALVGLALIAKNSAAMSTSWKRLCTRACGTR